MFWGILEVGAILLLFLFGVTQILIPSFKGTPWFPAFRKRKVYGEIKQANDDIDDERLAIEAELARLQAKALREKRIKNQSEETGEQR